MVNFMQMVIVLFGLPISFVFDIVLRTQKWIRNKLYSSPKRHDQRVRRIQKDVQNWNKLPKEKRKLMCTSRPNYLSLSVTFFNKKQCQQIDVNLFDILQFDEEKRTIRVEPMVTVGEATAFLVPRGYTLAVCLEIADATLGGLALAVGMTTHSHKVGLIQETVAAFEVVLADGRLVRATPDNEFSDLYYALPWSHGTLGFLVALELKVIPCKPYIHMRYIPVYGQSNYCDQMRQLSGALDPNAHTPDYLEATVFNRDAAVIMVGNFADVKAVEQVQKINNITKWYKPWFYKHVESFLKKGESEEYIPLDEYLLRHNRAIFWVLESMIPFGNNPIFRLFLGWLCPPKIAFLKWSTTPGIREMTVQKQVFQDIVLPMTVLEDSINKAEELFDTYPVLIYPCRIYNHATHQGQLRPPRSDQMCPRANYAMFYDLGVYGVPGPVKRKEPYNAVKTMRKMEAFIRDAGGYSFLYADTFMNWEEFHEMFDLTLYGKVRQKYGAEGAFPHLYDKIKPEINVFQLDRIN